MNVQEMIRLSMKLQLKFKCKSNADQGYECQLESSDGRRCLNSCLPTRQREKLQSSLTTSSRK